MRQCRLLLCTVFSPPTPIKSSVLLSRGRFSSRRKMSCNACDSMSEEQCLWLALAGSKMGLGAGFWRLALSSCLNTTAGQDGKEASFRIIPAKASSPAQAAHPQSSTDSGGRGSPSNALLGYSPSLGPSAHQRPICASLAQLQARTQLKDSSGVNVLPGPLSGQCLQSHQMLCPGETQHC